MPDEVTLKAAAEKRQEEIRQLSLCRCAYPIDRYRNGSGHAPSCPTHQDFLAKFPEWSRDA